MLSMWRIKPVCAAGVEVEPKEGVSQASLPLANQDERNEAVATLGFAFLRFDKLSMTVVVFSDTD